jgi:hypothetical protein
MMEARDLYNYMTHLSERYEKLKSIFDNFTQFASTRLTNGQCPVKGIVFLPKLDNNYLDVSFAGKKIRFTFFALRDENNYLRGFIKCNPINEDEKTLGPLIGEVSFNVQGETNLKTPIKDSLFIDNEWGAGYLVLNYLFDGLDKYSPKN